jgi:hypothetical protein
MRCSDEAWLAIYDDWKAKQVDTREKLSKPLKTGDKKIDDLEEEMFRRYVKRES